MSPLDERVESLYGRALVGERRALGQLISTIEGGGAAAEEISGRAHAASGRAHVVGMTGAPGSGKSTLIGAILDELVGAGRRPAVLAVDPSSPVSGGAILGDRIRMGAGVEAAFVRSLATRGNQGGLSTAVPDAVRLLDAVGYDPVIVETTGVGQTELDIVGASDTTALVVAPGWGDAVQANKAGLLEVADVLVVNKADRPGAQDARRDLELMLDLGHMSGHEQRVGRRAEIVLTAATTGGGVASLCAALDAHLARLRQNGTLRDRRRQRLRREVGARLDAMLSERRRQAARSPQGERSLIAAEQGEISPSEAARQIVRVILGPLTVRDGTT